MTSPPATDRRLLALYVLCLGALMIFLDTTVVTVALPSIQSNLGFSGTQLTWVLNAYMVTFGGFLLLGGRLGDLYGKRRLFLAGIAVFTLASLACGLAQTQLELVIARAGQGLGGAVVAALSLSLIMSLYVEPDERAMAMGVFGFVSAAGGSLGELLGGFLTQTLGWHSIFLINLPIGVAVYALCLALLPRDGATETARSHDVLGALTITAALMLAVYAVVDASEIGWAATRTSSLLGIAAALLAAFFVIEAKVAEPLVPLRLFRLRNLAGANAAGVLWAAGLFAWFITSALYLQRVLRYDPLEVGLAFIPADVMTAAFSAGLSAKMVVRFGVRGPLTTGLLVSAVGLALFARAPVAGTFTWDVLAPMLLLGLGAGMAFNPLLLAAMNDVGEQESGLASGVVNTSFTMGGALGLAALTSLADVRGDALRRAGGGPLAALNGGYHVAFGLGALLSALAALLCVLVLRTRAAAAEPASTGVN
ncbi:MAG: DHA2 family efflux MFS transporter permease subunit [Steroidobacteraceae bacterium]